MGDNSITWDKENIKIMQTFAKAPAIEKTKAAVQDDALVREIG
jgi:hypothetical protein